MANYLKDHGSTKATPQSEPMASDQVKNSAGGYTWQADTLTRLRRFLILGAEGGTFYVGERQSVRDNMAALGEVTSGDPADGEAAVAMIVDISDRGLAKSNDPALFALAYLSVNGSDAARAAAYAALPKVARITTHLFHFIDYRQGFGGWSRGLRNAVGRWYTERSLASLATQLIKYRQRDGWTHRDVLRKAHVAPDGPLRNALLKFAISGEFEWAAAREGDASVAVSTIEAFQLAQRPECDAGESAALIRSAGLPREAIKTDHLSDPRVWEALLENMPMEAMVRNLATMARGEILKPLSSGEARVCEKLAAAEEIEASRIHPLSVLNARMIYAAGGREGYGLSRGGAFPVSDSVVTALDGAFGLAFENVVPAGKRFLLGLDVSGSMGHPISGSPVLSCRDAAAAMALITAATEPLTHCIAFTSSGGGWGVRRDNAEVTPFPLAGHEGLGAVTARMDALQFGATDCALPMLYATANSLEVDCFVIYTDNETWAGNVHPMQALKEYRAKSGIDAKLVVVSMTAGQFSIADPNDPGALDVVGFDASTPAMLSAFVRGEI